MLIEREYLVEIDARDSTGATVVLRYSRDGYMARRSDTPADTAYEPRVADPGELSLYLWGAGTTGGSSDVGWGSITLHNADAGLDYLLEDGYGLAGVALRVLIGAPGAALATFSPLFAGVVESLEWAADGMVRIAARDRQHMLSVAPLQTTLYAGTNEPPNGLEGLARDLKGKGKPRLYGGQARNFAPALVNAARLIYQVSDRPVASVDAVYEGGARIMTGVETPYSALAETLSTVSYSYTFTSADVSTGADTLTLTGAVFNVGDAVTFKHGSFNPFPSPIQLSPDPARPNESKTYYTPALNIWDLDLYASTSIDAKLDLTTAGMGGITFTANVGGLSGTFTSSNVSTGSDSIYVADLVDRYISGTWGSVKLSYPAGTPILPAPLAKSTTYYLSGTSPTVKVHPTAADAVAGTNALNLTSSGASGVTFTATVTTAGTVFESWGNDITSSAVNTSTERITITGHRITTGEAICWRLKTGDGTLPAPLTAGVYYYVRVIDADTIEQYGTRAQALATSFTTGRINLTSTGSTPFGERFQVSRTYVVAGTYRWASDATAGTYLRLGSKPTKQITCDATAKAAAADRTVAQVLQAIALDAGVDAGDIDAADVTALDAACAYEVAEYLSVGDSRSARTVMDAVAASIGAWYCFDALGVLRMGRLVAPSGTPVIELDVDTIMRGAVERTQAGDDGSGVPTWRCSVSYARSVVAQDTDQLVASATDDQAAYVGREYREAVSEDETVLDVHPGAPERAFVTRLVLDTDASDEATRLQALYGTRRDLLRVRVPLTADVAALELGEVVRLTWPHLGLSAGRLLVLIGTETTWRDDQTTLLLWG